MKLKFRGLPDKNCIGQWCRWQRGIRKLPLEDRPSDPMKLFNPLAMNGEKVGCSPPPAGLSGLLLQLRRIRSAFLILRKIVFTHSLTRNVEILIVKERRWWCSRFSYRFALWKQRFWLHAMSSRLFVGKGSIEKYLLNRKQNKHISFMKRLF